MSTFLIVGRNYSILASHIISRGDKYVVLYDTKNGEKVKKAGEPRIYANFDNFDDIKSALKKEKFDGVVNVYERYVETTAKITEYLGLPGLPVLSAQACSDKLKMRKLFKSAPFKISPDFAHVSSENDIINFASNHNFPLILKPANLSKSLLVSKSNNLKELKNNYKKTTQVIDKVYQKYAHLSEPKLLIEEYIDGSVHSVDAFTGKDGEVYLLENIVDYQTGYDVGYDDNFHYSRILPSKLSSKQQSELLKCAEQGIKALGMKSSPAHVEIIYSKEGPRIVEIGARNGGYRHRMHWLANGIDIYGAALDIAMGREPNIRSTKNDYCAVIELFPKKPGEFITIENQEKLIDMPSLIHFKVKAEKGTFVGKSSAGYKMCAIIVLHNTNNKLFQKDLSYIREKVTVKTG